MMIKKRIPGIVFIVVIILITGLLLSSCVPFQSFHNKDGWKAVIQSVKDGTYKEKYSIGDTLELDLGSEGIVEMQIVAFDADELADGSGKAAITWISKQLLNSDHRMNPKMEKDTSDSSKYVIGTGCIGGWKDSEMRAWLQSDVKALIPPTVRRAIKPVTKYSISYNKYCVSSNTGNEKTLNEVSVEDIWIPSWRELYGSKPEDSEDYSILANYIESEGATYTLFDSEEDRVKQKVGESDASGWWLRSGANGDSFYYISQNGNNSCYYAEDSQGVALGFCI